MTTAEQSQAASANLADLRAQSAQPGRNYAEALPLCDAYAKGFDREAQLRIQVQYG
jgi:hypothetical protein